MYQIYLKVQAIYQKKYGPQTAVLMQVGKFFEMYTVMKPETNDTFTIDGEGTNAFDLEGTNAFDLEGTNAFDFEGADPEISRILDIAQNLKNGKLPAGPSNPYMMGFPLVSLDRYLEKLMAENWTVVQINQIALEDFHQKLASIQSQSPVSGSPEKLNHSATFEIQSILNPRHPKTQKLLHEPRWVMAIHSPGTYINPNHQQADNLYLTGLYIQGESRGLMTVALVNLNLETGESHCYQVSSLEEDRNLALDETVRFLNTYPARELLVIFHEVGPKMRSYIDNYLSLESQNLCNNLTYMESFPKDFLKLAYQEQLLKQIFPETGRSVQPNIIAYLGIGQYPSLVTALCIFLQFVHEHNETLLIGLSKPVFWEFEHHLTLDNNCITQLELINSHLISSDRYRGVSRRYTSILNLIDWTVTPLGHRLLKERLLNPILDAVVLNQRYAYTQAMLDFSPNNQLALAEIIVHSLKRSPDYVLLHHRISRQELEPKSFKLLDAGYSKLNKILELIADHPVLKNLLPSPRIFDSCNTQFQNSSDFQTQFQEFRKFYKSRLDLELASQQSLTNLVDSFFIPGHYPELDNLSSTIRLNQKLIQSMAFHLSQLIDPKINLDSENSWPVKVKIIDNDHFLCLTTNRYQKLKEAFPINGEIKFSDLTINKESRGKGSKTYNLSCPQLQKCSTELYEAQESLREQLPKIYLRFLRDLDQKYQTFFQNFNTLVAQLDLYQSQARVAVKYHYCRPEAITDINVSDSSKLVSNLEVRQLRHPLAERINQNSIYVPTDLSLGQFQSQSQSNINVSHEGFLVFGLNGSGKSVLMKAVGVAVIMAQAGFFVAAESFRFIPYQYILTRILGNDNIHKGLSSFGVEMSELGGILARANHRSLVLGDEVCRGTENVSGTSIVASTLLSLLEARSSFIFASHLHQLCGFSKILELQPRLGIYHLKLESKLSLLVNFNDISFNRTLSPGPGDPIYGLEVARAMNLPKTFCDRADEFRRILTNTPKSIQPTETSHYNRQVYRPNFCSVCQLRKPMDTHHILPQKDADSHGFIGHVPKNHSQNLVWLCRECHLQTENPRNGELLVFTNPTTWHYQKVTKIIAPRFRLRTEN